VLRTAAIKWLQHVNLQAGLSTRQQRIKIMARGSLSQSNRGGISERGFNNPLFTPFLALYRDINRMFEDGSSGAVGASLAGVRHGAGTLIPHIDVSETEQEVRIIAEIPGVNEDDIEVMVNDDMLVIRAQKQMEREEDRENYHVSERVFGTFQRTLQLPFPVEPDQVQARFENGVLNITLPKTQSQDRSHRIQVQGRGNPDSQVRASGGQSSQAQRGQGGSGNSGG
jgi:HSP20 family protein